MNNSFLSQNVFGITEASDASVNYSWINKMDTVDGAILITKEITPEFISRVLPFKHKVIVHVTCTGYGGSVIEPNVPHYTTQLNMARELIAAGFPQKQLVLRVDPIFPTAKGLETAKKVILEGSGFIHRIRISVVDMYPHVRERMMRAGLEPVYGAYGFSASKEQLAMVDAWILDMYRNYKIPSIESCGEEGLEQTIKVGCCSPIDRQILGLPQSSEAIKTNTRKGCLCSGDKKELLTGADTRQPCKNGCLYCYWKYRSE